MSYILTLTLSIFIWIAQTREQEPPSVPAELLRLIIVAWITELFSKTIRISFSAYFVSQILLSPNKSVFPSSSSWLYSLCQKVVPNKVGAICVCKKGYCPHQLQQIISHLLVLYNSLKHVFFWNNELRLFPSNVSGVCNLFNPISHSIFFSWNPKFQY